VAGNCSSRTIERRGARQSLRRPSWCRFGPVGVLALVATIALVGSASATAGAGAAPERRPDLPLRVAQRSSDLDWRPCEGGAECATLRVPLDYAHPKAKQIDLALLRVVAGDPSRRIGSLVVNPGGPGVSGLTLPLQLRDAALRTGGADVEVFARYDVLGFDPRGVGNSTPVQCGDVEAFYASDVTPDTDGERRALVDETRKFASDCRANGKEVLTHVGTRDAARDLDRIRVAVGDERFNYLGFSYGTELGAAYARQFPKRVGRLVLDGALDPKVRGVGLFRQQARSLEQSFDRFAADCSADPACAFYSGGDSASAFDRLVAQLDAAPLPGGGARTLTASQAVTAVATALFERSAWPAIANALAAGARGDGAPLLSIFDTVYAQRGPDGTYENLASAGAAVNCADYRWPRGDAGYDALVTRIRRESPRFGQAFVWEALPCAYWPTTTGTATTKTPSRLPPILVVGTTGDPATPYAWSRALTKALPGSVLLTREGEGHTAYLGGNQCIDDAVDQYLLSGATPPAGTRC
jgi:pimeloyl-ACP methyl ester carboxylesterase